MSQEQEIKKLKKEIEDLKSSLHTTKFNLASLNTRHLLLKEEVKEVLRGNGLTVPKNLLK